MRALDWEEEADNAERMRGPAEVELEHFRFPFAGREWDSFFYTRPGLISFGMPIPSDYGWPARFGTMSQVFDLLAITPMISALYKPHLRGQVQVSSLPNRVIVSFSAWDRIFLVYGREPKGTFDFQIVLHADDESPSTTGPSPGSRRGVRRRHRRPAPGSRQERPARQHPRAGGRLRPRVSRSGGNRALCDRRAGRVLVEFTTRGPIRPIPNQEIVFMVEIDDWDFFAGVALQPDGSRTRVARPGSVRPRCR